MKSGAFIFFGQVKNYNNVQHQSFTRYIKPSFQGLNVDYFLITSRNKKYYSERQSRIEGYNVEINYNSINSFFNFSQIIYDDIDQQKVSNKLYDFSNFLVDTYRNENFQAWGKNSKPSTFNSIKQLYSLNYFLNKFMKQIKKYDFFILARSDIFYTHKLILPELTGKNIFTPSFGHWGAPPTHKGGCNDRFCLITSSDILKLYCRRFFQLKECPEFYHAEDYLNKTLSRSMVNFKELDNFRFRLLRSNNVISSLDGMHKDERLTNKFFYT